MRNGAKGRELARFGIAIPDFNDYAFELLRYMATSKPVS
jgi:hypothetical protein